jgi:hypothetical protein
MEIVGYAQIKKDAKTGISAIPLEKFFGYPCRVLEFASDGGVMVVDSGATGIATFDKCDILSSFKCSIFGNVICPPDLDLMGKMAYSAKCMGRKTGYNDLLLRMVIHLSLFKNKFDDSILWAKQ